MFTKLTETRSVRELSTDEIRTVAGGDSGTNMHTWIIDFNNDGSSSASRAKPFEPGSTVTWTYEVTNTG